ncbi:MAG TPA: methionyl-tRNA formyltransferase [Thermoleophilaceae bacterium]|nr:methionyl-tRNA formyltransferase [Thermoleophilaceae bacterium]
MRTVYLGTTDFAATVLERLAASEHRPALVVTRPDRPRGRGRKLAAPPVARSAAALGIELDQPASVNGEEARERIAAARPEAVCICAYGALIKEPLLSDHPMLNVHPSLLPRWRGAAPIERAIEAGDRLTGVSIMRPVAELDAGPVCLVRSEPIDPGDDYGSLAGRLAELAGDLLVAALDSSPPFREQPSEGTTDADKIEPGERLRDPALGAAALERRVRALTPHVGAYVELAGGDRLGVRRARALPVQAAEPGELSASGQRLLLGTAGGALELLEVPPAGRRPMEAAADRRGQGAALASPPR